MNGGIKIKYSDYEEFVKQYKKQLGDYTTWFNKYLGYLKQVCDESITSGKVHDGLEVFRLELTRVAGMPEVVANKVEAILNTYMDELHTAQQINGVSILYDRDYKGYRDYTGSYFIKLEQMSECDNYDEGFWNGLWDAVEDFGYGIEKFFGCHDNSKEKSIQDTHEALLHYNDVTRRQVRNIKRKIGDADEKCAQHLEVVESFVWQLGEYIRAYRDMMIQYQYSPSSFSVEVLKFSEQYAAMLSAYNDVLVCNVVTDEDVEAFIDSEGADQLMDEQVQIVYDYIADLSQLEISDYDFWKIVIFQMFDIAEGQIVSGGEYDKLLMKKELTDMMDDLAKNYVYSESSEQEALDAVNEFFKEAEKSGKTVYEFLNSIRGEDGKLILDGRTKKAREFKGFLESLDNAQDILKYGDQGIEILTKLFIDYDKNLEFLDSFERNATLSDEMQACFDELRATYEHDLNQTVKDIGTQILENGVDALYSLSIGKMVGKVKATIGFIGEVTGENAKTAAQLQVVTYGYDIVGGAQSAFVESMRKLKAASKDAENYEQLMDDFKNCFTIYKSSLARMFEKMAVSADSPQRDYFYYCSSEVSSMSLKEFSNPDFMSYEEYLKDGYAY